MIMDGRHSRRAQKMREDNRAEDRPIRECDIKSLAYQSARRDNPAASPSDLHRSAALRIERGVQPYQGARPAAARSPTAVDLRRAARKAQVRSNRHLRS